jgi:hypothetical protein
MQEWHVSPAADRSWYGLHSETSGCIARIMTLRKLILPFVCTCADNFFFTTTLSGIGPECTHSTISLSQLWLSIDGNLWYLIKDSWEITQIKSLFGVHRMVQASKEGQNTKKKGEPALESTVAWTWHTSQHPTYLKRTAVVRGEWGPGPRIGCLQRVHCLCLVWLVGSHMSIHWHVDRCIESASSTQSVCRRGHACALHPRKVLSNDRWLRVVVIYWVVAN